MEAHPGAAAPSSIATERSSDAVGHPSGLAIIASKISPAIESRLILTRARLVSWLEHQAQARLILITAEAGYGKSTLLNDFARRSDQTFAWYRLESSDSDWITFLSYLVATLRGVVPDFGRPTEALLRNVAAMGSSRELVLSQFLSDLGDVGTREALVILDDYHLVSASADVRMIMSRLLERAPVGMRFVIAGRGRPNLALGRMIAQGRVSELTTGDLRFSTARDRGALRDRVPAAARPACLRCRHRADTGLGGQPPARRGVRDGESTERGGLLHRGAERGDGPDLRLPRRGGPGPDGTAHGTRAAPCELAGPRDTRACRGRLVRHRRAP